MRTIAVVVQACPAPGRPGWADVQASIETSDIGKNYQALYQPPGRSIREHFLDSLRRGADTGADLVLRLEDDIEVNRHILDNLRAWPAIDAKQFGVGWAFDPGGVANTTYHRKWDLVPTKWYWHDRKLSGSLAVLMWSKDVPTLCRLCEQWFAQHNSPCEQDLALSCATLAMGRRIAVHAPSLVEHRPGMASQLNHQHEGIRASSSGGSFLRDWHWAAPVYDRHGRLVKRGRAQA